jgi:hypothetical protein
MNIIINKYSNVNKKIPLLFQVEGFTTTTEEHIVRGAVTLYVLHIEGNRQHLQDIHYYG